MSQPVKRVAPAERHLIALDIDGTLMHHDGRLDDEVADEVRRLYDLGHEIIISTGRSVDSTLPVVEQLRLRPDWVVSSNGAVTLKRDPLADRAYRREYVETFDVSEMLNRVRSHLLTATYGVEVASGELLFTDRIPARTLPVKQRQVSFDELLGVQATRVVVVSPDGALEEFLKVVDTIGLTRVSYAIGQNSWLDIAPEGVSKASALEVIRGKLDIPLTRVFAAGDGNNDLQMLRWASRHGDGVAMGQAADDVKASAGRVAGTIDDLGLATALRDRFPLLPG